MALFETTAIRFATIFFIILPLFTLTLSEKTSTKRIVCYYTFPTNQYTLQPSIIDSSLCTHIIVGFSTIQNSSVYLTEKERNVIKQVVGIKKQNTNLTVMLSIGGASGSQGFPEMAKNSSNRSKFINSLKSVLKELDLDGVDLDWEFPDNKSLFIQLLEDIKNTINISTEKFQLSVAVGAPVRFVERSYNIPEINRLVDFVNLISYVFNLYLPSTPRTGINAPLYGRSSDNSYTATKNINFTSHYWLQKGMSKEKLNIGLSVYARTYKLASPNETYIGAPAVGHGKVGYGGSAKYGPVCDFIKQEKLTPIFDEETKCPYVWSGLEWISFENDLSMKYKAEYVFNNDYGGVMVFSLNSDDFQGRCKPGITFPNTRKISEVFTNNITPV